MPTVVPLYKRSVRRCAAAGVKSPASTTRTTANSTPEPSDWSHGAGHRHRHPGSQTGAPSPSQPQSCFRQDSSSSSGSDCSECSDCESTDGSSGYSSRCFLCRKDIRYFPETLTCGHVFHSDCYWRWIRVRSNRPEEKSICPSCGFLTIPSTRKSMDRAILADVTVTSGRKTSKCGHQRRRMSSSSDSDSMSSSSSSCSSDSDIFFL